MAANIDSTRNEFVRNAIEAVIKIGAILIILLACFAIVRPFVGIVVWGIIIAVAIFPIAAKIAAMLGGRHRTATVLITIILLIFLVLPAIELAAIVLDNVDSLRARIDQGSLDIPMPPESVSGWPLIGGPVADFWTLAATNLTEALTIIQPQLQAAATWLVGALAGIGLGVIQFIAAIIIAGVFMATAPASANFARALARRLAGERGDDLVELSSKTVRGVARGVLGVAVIQSSVAGIGLVLAGIPGAGIWTLACLLLAIIQIGVAPIMIGATIYMFSTAETLPAVLFLIFAVVVSGSDNILKPMLMGRGLEVPMLVIMIGTIGGMLMSGIVGLFIGAVILALGYELFVTWVYEPDQSATAGLADTQAEEATG